MQARLSRRLPPHRIRVTSSGSRSLDGGAVRGEGLVEPGGHVAQHLVAARWCPRPPRRPRRCARARRSRCAPRPRAHRRPGARPRPPARSATPAEPSCAEASRPPSPTSSAVSGSPPASSRAEPERLQRQLVDLAALVLHERENAHHATPRSRITPTTAGAASAPSPRISACLPGPPGTTSRSFSRRELRPLGRALVDGLLARAQLGRHRRVAREVDSLEHA